MPDTGPERDGLNGLSPLARSAVAGAEREARRLGLGRLGTEHLLLGVLTVADGRGAAVLHDAGVVLEATRRKVDEAVNAGTRSPVGDPDGPLDWSPRAERALGRAHRFAQEFRAANVGTAQLLLGVLDVEGTAGQVLRGLSADLDAIRSVLETALPDGAASDAGTAPDRLSDGVPDPICPACGADLDGGLVHRTMTSRGAHGDREVVAFSCAGCGAVLTVTPPPR